VSGRPFSHLHVKSQYSLLGALGTPGQYAARAKALGMGSLALTDEMNLFGAVEFGKACKSEGIHPVFGTELIVAPGSRADKNKPRENFRLVALARNKVGYVTLNYLVSEGYLSGRHFVPRIDKQLLQEQRDGIREGLILLSGDLRGELGRLLAREDWDGARAAARFYEDLAGPGNFYLELMDLGWGSAPGGLSSEADQRQVNERLRTLSAEMGIPLVCSNNVHYPESAQAWHHEVLLCLGGTTTLSDEFRFRFPSDQFFLKSPDQMYALFAGDEQALANSQTIAERCEYAFKDNTYHFPVYPRLQGRTPMDVLRDLARDGLDKRLAVVRKRKHDEDWESVEKRYRDRLEEELRIIEPMGFAAYFLIVYDFINWAKEHGIPVGPGRGSGAGSLVLYSLRVTDIDPLPYKLLFERFLNPERVSMPDVDVDFCQDRRGEVIAYVNGAYGGETRVSQIITFGKMLAKGVLRDVGRVMGLSFGEVDRIAKLVPEKLGITLQEAVEKEPRLKDLMEKDPKVQRLVEISLGLEGTTRHASVHAAGVVIADDDLRKYCPLYKGGGDGDPTCTQFDMKWSETIGLIKFDFLGLKTLTQTKNALDMARANGRTDYDFFSFNEVPLDDAEVYRLLARGDTLGVFQLESSGMRQLLRDLKPTRFEDIIAVAALYRPGPMGMGMHHTFAACKNGRQRVAYPHPMLEPILADTYGVIVFQEQVMQTAQVMAGYSLGEADLLRRAMGKKKKEEMDKQRARFVGGAQERGVSETKANEVFDLMASFAEYGFNKSHTAAYGLIAYQTAWLKQHLPAEFYASLLSIEAGNTDKVLVSMDDARRHGIEVLPPDVNESQEKFTVVGDRIRFGLSAVKGVGAAALETILEARKKSGARGFRTIEDFLGNVDHLKVNKAVLEALIKCGAFDSVGSNRATLFANVERLIEYTRRRAEERDSGQVGLFGMKGGGGAAAAGRLNLPPLPEWAEKQKLQMEKEALGLYISGHPMRAWQAEVESFTTATTATLGECKPEQEVRVAGIVGSIRVVTTKAKGERMAFVQFEDPFGSVEITFFPRAFEKAEPLLLTGEPILVRGKVDEVNEDEGTASLLADEATLLSEVREAKTSELRLRLEGDDASGERLAGLRALLEKYPGRVPVKIEYRTEADALVVMALPERWRVAPVQALVEETEGLFGRRVTGFR
jgi:DNA polymerase-3 subunit alpha